MCAVTRVRKMCEVGQSTQTDGSKHDAQALASTVQVPRVWAPCAD